VPWLDDTFGEHDRGLAYGGLNLIYALGYTVGPLLGGWLLGTASADTAYFVITGLSLLLAFALAITHGAGRAPARAESAENAAGM
jgi:MFS family permease